MLSYQRSLLSSICYGQSAVVIHDDRSVDVSGTCRLSGLQMGETTRQFPARWQSTHSFFIEILIFFFKWQILLDHNCRITCISMSIIANTGISVDELVMQVLWVYHWLVTYRSWTAIIRSIPSRAWWHWLRNTDQLLPCTWDRVKWWFRFAGTKLFKRLCVTQTWTEELTSPQSKSEPSAKNWVSISTCQLITSSIELNNRLLTKFNHWIKQLDQCYSFNLRILDKMLLLKIESEVHLSDIG